MFCLGGFDGATILDKGQYFDFTDNEWREICSMSLPRSAFGAAFLNGKVYVTGGWNGKDKIYWECECYDPDTDTWSDIPPLEKERRGHSSFAYKNRVYVLGGQHSQYKAIGDMSFYDCEENAWIVAPTMCTCRRYLSTVILDDLIYAIGGRSTTKTLRTVERFNSKTETWDLVSSLNEIRWGSTACVIGGYIYVAGGWDGNRELNSIERYDPEKDKWERLDATMTTRRREMGSFVYQNELYIIGGYYNANEKDTKKAIKIKDNKSENLCEIPHPKLKSEKFNFETKTWKEGLSNMTMIRSAFAVVVDYRKGQNKFTQVQIERSSQGGVNPEGKVIEEKLSEEKPVQDVPLCEKIFCCGQRK